MGGDDAGSGFRTFVGRDREVGVLTAAVHDARAGRGALVLVTGEAGIGKSRLVTEVAGYAERSGLAVAWGTSRPVGSRPLGPWVEVLRGLGAPPLHDITAAEASREAAFDAVAGAIEAASRVRPSAVFLEDVHWADEATLLQLEWLRPALGRLPLLVVATSRSLPPRVGRPDLHLALAGLSPTEVAMLLGAVLPDPATDAVDVHARTGGNPFFVLQVATWGTSGVPPTVADLLEARTAALPPEARSALAGAAVLGTELAIGTLDALVPGGGRSIRVAVDAGLIVDAGGGRLKFVHELLRDVVLRGLDAGALRSSHRRAVDVLGQQPDADPVTVAEHADAAGDRERLALWAARAGDAAAAVHAHEVAARWYERALAAERDDSPEALDLLLSAADAWGRAGHSELSWPAFERAAERARALGDTSRLATAALGFGGGSAGFEVPPFHEHQRALLEEAARALPRSEHTLRALVLSRLSVAMSFERDLGHRRALVDEAVADARASADPAAKVAALSAWCDAHAGPDDIDARMRAADEMVAASSGNRSLELLGLRFRIVARLERGDLAASDIARFARLSGELREPRVALYVPLFRAMRALADGRLGEADSLNEEVFRIARAARSENGEMLAISQRMGIRLHQGRASDVEEMVRAFVEAYPDISGPHVGLAMVEARTGRAASARARLDRMLADDFAAFPRDAEWLASMVTIADVAVWTRHRAVAERLLHRLVPYRSLLALDGIGAALFGPVARWAAQLADLAGATGDADALHADALAVARRAGAPLLVAQSAAAWAQSLSARGDDRAAELDAIAAGILRERDLPRSALMLCGAAGAGAVDGDGLAGSGQGGDELGGSVRRPVVAAPERPDEGAFECGEVWLARWRGREARLRDSKGLRYLAELVRRPHVDVHVLQLASPASDVRPDSDLGPLVDDRARNEYRRRIEALRVEIEDARTAQDLRREQRLEEELEAIVSTLAAATGLGGRARRPGSAAERARVNVTKSIKQALDRIEPQLPDLAHHLRTTVRTGTFCRYEPDPARPPVWHVR